MASKSQVTFDLLAKDVSVSKTLGQVEKKAGSFKAGMLKIGAAIGAAFAARQVIDFARDSLNAARDAQKAQNLLTDAYERFPAVASVNIDALRKYNEERAKVTRYDDDVTASAQAVLAQYNLNGEQLKELTPLLQDYAAKTGKDLPTAAEDMGKAILGQGRALKAIGLDFSDTGDATSNYTQLVDGLRQQVGGFAEKDAQTFDGKLEMLQNRFGEVQEVIGTALMGPMDELLTWFNEDGMQAVESFANDALVPGIETLGDLVGKIIEYKDLLGPAAIAVGVLTAAQWLLNAAMDANPVGAVIVALEALIALAALVVTNWDTIAPAVITGINTVAQGVLAVQKWIAGGIGGMVNMVVDGVNGILGVIDTVRKAINLPPSGVRLSHVDFTSGFDIASGRLNDAALIARQSTWDGLLPSVYGDKAVNRTPSSARTLERGTAFAEGGIVSAATIALIGERGEQEAVVPYSKTDDFISWAASSGWASAGAASGGGHFTGELRRSTGEFLGVVDGRIAAADAGNVRTSKMGKQK